MKPTIFWISYDQSTFLTIIQLISQRLTDILDIYMDIIDISHIKHVQYVYIYICTNIWLVVSTPLKNMSSAVGIIIPNIWKVIKIHGSKPSTRYIYIYICNHMHTWFFSIISGFEVGLVPTYWINNPHPTTRPGSTACHGHGSVLGSWANVP